VGYIELTSYAVTGMGIVPGVAASGILNFSTMSASGFAFSGRPQDLTGYWQYMAFGSDKGFFDILLTKWNPGLNQRDTIAYNHHKLAGMEMAWVSFAIPLIYYSGGFPDTASILLSSSGPNPVAGSYVFVDSLAFSGSVAGIQQHSSSLEIEILPNPVVDNLNLRLSSSKTKGGLIEIFDTMGRKVKSLNDIDFVNKPDIDISELAKGEYILKFSTSKNETTTIKFIKQ